MVSATHMLTGLSNASTGANTASGTSQNAAPAGDAARLHAAIATFGSFAAALGVNSAGAPVSENAPGPFALSSFAPSLFTADTAQSTGAPGTTLQTALQSALLGSGAQITLPETFGTINAADLEQLISGELPAGFSNLANILPSDGFSALSNGNLATLPEKLAERFAAAGFSPDQTSSALDQLSTMFTGLPGQTAPQATEALTQTPALALFLGKVASGEIELPVPVLTVLQNGGTPTELRQAFVNASTVNAEKNSPVDKFATHKNAQTAPLHAMEPLASTNNLAHAASPAPEAPSNTITPTTTLVHGDTSHLPTGDVASPTPAADPSKGLMAGKSSPAAQKNTTAQTVDTLKPLGGDRAALVDAAKKIVVGLRNAPATGVAAPSVGDESKAGAPSSQALETRTPLANLVTQLQAGEITIQSAREVLIAGGRPDIASRLAQVTNGAAPAVAKPMPEGIAHQTSVAPDFKTGSAFATPQTPSTPIAERTPILPWFEQFTHSASAKPFGETGHPAKGQPFSSVQQSGTANANEAQITKALPEQAAVKASITEIAREPGARPDAAALFQHKSLSAVQTGTSKPSRATGQIVQANAISQAAPSSSASVPVLMQATNEIKPAVLRQVVDLDVVARLADRPVPQVQTAPTAMTSAPAQEAVEVTTSQLRPEAAREHATEVRAATRFDAHTRAAAVQDMSVAITRFAGQGLSRFQIRLDPAELGRVDVRLEIRSDGRVIAHVATERPETLDILRQDSRALERAFQDAGLKTDQNSLNFSLKEQNTGAQQGRDGDVQPTWGGEDEGKNEDVNLRQEIIQTAVPIEIMGGLRLMVDRGIDVTV